MGWFSKKDKEAGSGAGTPDTAASNPYAQPPPAYNAGGQSNTSYGDNKSNMSGGYGGSSGGGGYGNEPSGYGGGAAGGRNPYAGGGGNPYASGGGNSGGGGGGYGSSSGGGGYGSSGGGGGYGRSGGGYGSNKTTSGGGGGGNPYASGGGNPYSSGNEYSASKTQSFGSSGAGGGAGGGGYNGQGGGPGGYGSSAAYSQPSGYSNYKSDPNYDPSNPYSTGENRQLTAEQEEEEDVDALKSQIRFTKQESVASTRNALQAAHRAEEVGRDTLTRLGEQGEKLHNTEMNIELARTHGMVAEDHADSLRRYNRSMFVPAYSPFNKAGKAAEKEQEIMARHQQARDAREGIYSSTKQSQATVSGGLQSFGAQNGKPRQKMSLAEKAKFQFEGDAEDDAMEDEIDDNLHQLSLAAGRLKGLAQTTGRVVDDQQKTIDSINDKTVKVDDQIAKNSHRLKKYGF